MQFRLRTLLIVLAIGPALLATFFWSYSHPRFPGFPLSMLILSPVSIWRARRVGRSAIAWTICLWAAGYSCGLISAVVSGESLLLLRRLGVLDSGALAAIVPQHFAAAACFAGLIPSASAVM